MSNNDDILISADEVCFSYDNSDNNYILKNISIDIKKGEFISIIGGNGSGKSTLAKSFNGLFVPNQGDVTVLGTNTKDDNEIFNIRKNVGLIFQNPDNQIVAGIVEEDVAFGPENLGIEPEEIRRRVEQALNLVDMYLYKDEVVFKLSGGQKQRVSIAGVLAMEPKCIIFDESTSMLDPQGRKDIMKIINHLKNEKKISIVLITHFMEEAINADRIVVMKEGRVIKTGRPKEIFCDYDFLKQNDLYAPECTEFMFKLKKSGFNLKRYGMNENECADILNDFIRSNKGKVSISSNKNDKLARKSERISISAKNIGYIYDKNSSFKNIALKNVSFDIREGEIIGIIGKTGSGKSTLINQISGILKPTSGKILINGNVGMVFQYPEYQLFEENVYKDIAFGPKNMNKSEADINKSVMDAIEFVGIDKKLLDKSPFEISGGEKRKVAIAGVIAMDPDILILDEPCAGLDPRSRERLLSKIISYHEKRCNTILLVSHYMDDIAKYVDKVMVMNEGNIESLLNVKETFENYLKLKEIGLDIPTISKIMNRLIDFGYKVDYGITDYDEAIENIISNLI